MDSSTSENAAPMPNDLLSSLPESKAQEQARLRRERRNAKIQAGGASRLAQITSLSGRPAAAEAELDKSDPTPNNYLNPPVRPMASSTASSVHSEDPEEVDISQMFQRSRPDASMGNQNDLFRQMLMGAGPLGAQGENSTGMPGQGLPRGEDPIMAMMQQMMGGSGGPGGGAGIPPGLASMLGGGGIPGQAKAPVDPTVIIWRIVHAVCALLLGIYTVSSMTFSGSKVAREYSDLAGPPKLFWMFTTMELVLQSTRYFMDGGHLPPSGILGTVGQFLPEPYSGYVRMFGRYSVYYTAVMSDVSVVIFVLGLTAWWKGVAIA